MSTVRRLRPSDVVAALSVAVLVIAHAAFEPGDRAATAVDFALLAAAALVLVAVRLVPVIVLAVTSVCVAVYLVRVGQDVVSVVPVLVAVYYTTRSGHRVVAPLACLPFVVLGFVNGTSPSDGILAVGWFAAALCFGEMHRQWRAYVAEARLRAEEAERTREEVAMRRASEERLRIARDLHDSLTNTISVVKVQAGVAVHLARKRGDAVPDALLAIQDAAGDAMDELRSTIDVLRSGDHHGGSLAQLPDLIRRSASAGVVATVTVTGDEYSLPAEVGRAAYRIVQEALTNVGRHAGTGSAEIGIAYHEQQLVVTVDDHGNADSGPHAMVPGTGLIGMRERVVTLGGDLEAGPREDGGFRVRATLPLDGGRS